jgi:uncharacterized protein (TIGR03083 family)
VPDENIVTLEAEWASLRALLADIDEEHWRVPTALPGWSVQDCVSHIVGTERMIMGDPAPEIDISDLDHVRNPFGEIVEVWVEERRPWPPARVLAEFDEQIPRRARQLHTMTEAELNEPIDSPLGRMPYRNFLEVRTFDTWMHEQDIRRALDQPGNLDGPIVDAALVRFRNALGYVVGKKAGAPDGASIVFDLVGGPGGAIAVVVDGRAQAVDHIPDHPSVHIITPFEQFVALGGGRVTADDALAAGVRIEGDEVLGATVLAAMAFTP